VFKMKFEWSFQDKFDVILVNDTLDLAIQKAQKLFTQFTS
jgi:guanylate kinase